MQLFSATLASFSLAEILTYSRVLRFNIGRKRHRRNAQISRESWASNSLLDLTHGPFRGTEQVNCLASRWPHIVPSEALVSRGGERAAGARGPRAANHKGLDPEDEFSGG